MSASGKKLMQALTAPFPAKDIEWRIQSAGKSNGGWAKAVPYISNRAIQERLDLAVGPENWKNEYRETPGGLLCGISIFFPDHGWVTKWDGAEDVEDHPVKGVCSNAMKRAGVQWGIGRYLYGLNAGWANIHAKGSHYGRFPKKEGGGSFKWDPPSLPRWALPDGDDGDDRNDQNPPPPPPPGVDLRTGEITEDHFEASEEAEQVRESNRAGLPEPGTAQAASILRKRIARALQAQAITDDQHTDYFRDIQKAEFENDMAAMGSIQDSLNAMAEVAKARAGRSA